MTGPLWRKAFIEARVLTASASLVLFAFGWLFVWLSSLIKKDPLADLLDALPLPIQKISGIPVEALSTPAGLVSVLYVDPVVLIACAIWAVTRGSDAVAGEIDRGTMEVLLAQPVRRSSVIVTHAVTSALGAAILAASLLLGNWVGIALVRFEDPMEIGVFTPAAINLFSFTLSLAAIAALMSSVDRYRWRTAGIAGGFFIIQLIIKVVSRMWPSGEWLSYATLFGAFEPQKMIQNPAEAWALSLRYDGCLLGIALAAYLVAGFLFCHRDVPAPL